VATSTYLLETRRLTVGEFRCPAGDPAWEETNYIGDEPHVVFPLTPVVIDQVEKGRVLTTANHTVFYDAGQHYRRRSETEHGDRCFFVKLRPRTFARLARSVGPGVLDSSNRLREIHAPNDRAAFLARHLLVRRLRGGSISARAAEEAALVLVAATLRRSVDASSHNRTSTAHRELAEAAKSVLARTFTESLPLGRLACVLGTSPYHLARVFRAETGFSVHAYRQSLRLRTALERMPTYGEGLTMLALELGFSSHSHFSAAFRREFGVAPSAVRAADTRRVTR
jgi:AraC family transcriptional regulator